MKHNSLILFLVLISHILTACGSSSLSIPRGGLSRSKATETYLVGQVTQLAGFFSVYETQVWQKVTQNIIDIYGTAAIEATENALGTVIAKPPFEAQATGTITPGEMATPLREGTSNKSLGLTSTPQPNIDIPDGLCENAALISETVPDWTNFEPGAQIIKTWRVKNIGSCTWKPNTQLVFVSGEQLDGPAQQKIGKKVKPGDEVSISVEMKAPINSGKYTGYWAFQTQAGTQFGLGLSTQHLLWASVNVGIPPVIKLDAIKSLSQAIVNTESGLLTCPNSSINVADLISIDNAPIFEGGMTDDEPALVMTPCNGPQGSISLRLPAFLIETGDHFESWISCLDGNKSCDLIYELNYTENNGLVTNLGSWVQKNDGVYEKISVDLSALAGQTVELALTVRSNNSNSVDNAGYWVTPVVIR